jgi:hypothetical protein
MAELFISTEKDKLYEFLRKQGADDIILEIQGMPLEKALEKVVMRGSNELVNKLLNEHPWVLEKDNVAWAIAVFKRSDDVYMNLINNYPEVLDKDGVAWNIAEYGSDEVLRNMMDKHPGSLKRENVARTIALYGSDEVLKHMIKNYPWVVKNPGVAFTIAISGGDNVVEYMIDTHHDDDKVVQIIATYGSDRVCKYMIDVYPEVLKMENVISGFALGDRSEVIAYALLSLGKIKPEDKNFTTSQFSMMFDVLNNDNDKEKVLKRIFFDNAATNSMKELDSMPPLYRTLLSMLNLSKDSTARLSKELSKSNGDVKRALPIRGLAYAIANLGDSEILDSFVKNSKSMMNSLKIFPTVCELKYAGIISDSEFKQISDSIDKEAELFKQLVQKVERTFNVKPKSDDAIKAMSDYIFLEDLFGLYAKYHRYNPQAESVLIDAVKHYFEGGIEEFKKFKFGGHDLASEQLRGVPPSKFMNLDKLAVTYTSKRSIPYDSVENDIDNFLNHKDKLLKILEEIEKDAENKLSQIAQIAKSKNSEELADLLNAKNLDGLTSHAFDPDNEKVKAKGIAQIKLLKARESLDFINNIVDELQKMSGKSKEEQDSHMAAIANKVRDWVDDKGLEPLKMLNNRYISKVNEQQISSINKEGLDKALANAISMVEVLLKYSKKAEETTVTAQITFDPSKILTFGRYGSSGAGNCQNSKGDANYNQSLMSMLGDANQLMIMFQEDKEILGFMQVHLLKSNKGMILFMEKPYTNEPDKSTAMKEAARMLAQKIKNETGFDCFTYGEIGDKIEKLTVEVPKSYVSRYIDFIRALKGPESFECEISAKCLTPPTLFELKR